MESTLFIYLCCAVIGLSIVAGNVEESLKYWETISVSSMKRHIVKRDLRNPHPMEQIVRFSSFGRDFSLVLRKDFKILARGFKIIFFEADGRSSEVHLDLNIYRGTLEGDANSSISAYLDDNFTLSASINTPTENYVIEPAWHLLPDSTNDTMIIYKQSDLIESNNSRCGYVNNDKRVYNLGADIVNNSMSNNRSKRGTGCKGRRQTTCHLFLAANPTYYKAIGRSSIKETASAMLTVIDRVDFIYRKSQFEGCDKGYGFEVERIHIFSGPLPGYKYTDNVEFNYYDLLEMFSEDPELKEVCLGILFLNQPINDNGYVLGLSYIASPVAHEGGGVCSIGNGNGIWVTTMGASRVPTMQSMIVTAHELGHAWGSPHDDDLSSECAPSASAGGKFIMYPVAVSGSNTNNRIFSKCSMSSMGRVLQQKSACFEEDRGAFCGNYRVELDEQCDPGFNVVSDSDECCDSKCQLRPSKKCSDSNSPCCEHCNIVSADAKICLESTEEDCIFDTYCDGKDDDCPKPKPKPDGTKCFNNGQCRNGECISLCEIRGLLNCECDDDEAHACHLCCRKRGGACFPIVKGDQSYIDLPPGHACKRGTCNSWGLCEKHQHSIIMRLWEILDLSSPSGFVKFMRNNIVWTIIMLSLVVWIPACCYISHLDKLAMKEREHLINEAVDEMFQEEEENETQEFASPSPSPPSTTTQSNRMSQRLQHRETQKAVIKNELRRITVSLAAGLAGAIHHSPTPQPEPSEQVTKKVVKKSVRKSDLQENSSPLTPRSLPPRPLPPRPLSTRRSPPSPLQSPPSPLRSQSPKY